MNVRMYSLVLCVIVLAAPRLCPASLIAKTDITFDGSLNKIFSSCVVDARIQEGSNYSSEIFGLPVDNSSKGEVLFSLPPDPNLTNFISYLKDGTDGWILLEFQGDALGANFSGGILKSEAFSGLQQDNINYITLTVNEFTLDSSSGLWTDYDCDFTLSLETPEPSTLFLLLAGVPIAVKRKNPCKK